MLGRGTLNVRALKNIGNTKKNKMKKEAKKAKREYEKKLAREIRHNKRAFFRYVNSKLTVRPKISQMQNELGT